MKPWRQCLMICALALASAAITYGIKGPPNRLFRCDPAALKLDEVCLESLPQDPLLLWVDARSRSDWAASGVPGSLLWNLDPAENMQAFEAEAAPRVAAASRVVVYCGDENCGVSRQVAARIRSLDLGPDVSVLRGGWRALRDAGRVPSALPKR